MIVGKIIQKGNHISTNNQFIANQYSDNLELQVELTDTTFENFELSFFYGINGLEKTGILEYDKLKRIIKLPFSAFDGVRKLYISCVGITTESDSTVTVTTNYIIFYNNETIDPNSVIEIQNGKTWMEAVHEMVLEELKNVDLGTSTSDYNNLKNIPTLNGKEVKGNLTNEDLGLKDGKSAYQIALDEGFVGSEQQWLESLKGKVGPRGPQGEQGVQGEQGIQGLTGLKGADGKTPVKGVDYFTEADKQEFTQSIETNLQPKFDTKIDKKQGLENQGKALIVDGTGNAVPQDLPKTGNSKIEIVYRYDFKGDVVELNQLLDLEDDVLYTIVLQATSTSPNLYAYLGSNSMKRAIIGYIGQINDQYTSIASIYQFFIKNNQLFTINMARPSTNWSQIYLGKEINDNTLIIRGSDVINNKTSVIVYKN